MDTLSVLITPIDDRIDLEVSGQLEHTDGMLEEFANIKVELIEKQSKSKQMERTTLLINGKFFFCLDLAQRVIQAPNLAMLSSLISFSKLFQNRKTPFQSVQTSGINPCTPERRRLY